VDVVLGVAVAGRVARLAMVGSPASGGQVLDQYALDLSDDAMTELADTIIGTYREVTDSGNRVAATRLCLPDPSAADTLRQTVSRAGVPNVEVVAEAEAAAALARSAGADAALLLSGDDTVSLTVVGEDEQSTSTLASLPIGAAGAAVACAAVLQHMPAAQAPMRVMLVGQRLDLDSVAAELRSTGPVEVAPDAGYAIARGAAQTADGSGFAPAGASTQMAPALDATQMAPAAADATQMAPAADATQMAPAADATQMAPANARAAEAVGPDLAYSQDAGDEPWADEMPMEPLSEFVPEQDDEADYTTAIAPPPPRMLLMGSAAMFLVISFATLAVTVAINIRPTADVASQPAPPTQANTVPGRYLPPVPHQADPVALPVSVLTPPPAAPVAPNVRDDRPVYQAPVNQAPPAAPVPAPAPPPVEVPPVPVPVPIPLPIPVPPLVPPWTPPWTFPSTPTTPPTTTTTTAPTTTTTPPTTTTTPPTTTPPTTTPPSTSTPTEPSTPTHTVTTYTTPSSAVTVIPREEPTYTAPAYTPPAQTAAPPPTHEAPQTTVYQQEPAYGGGSSGSGSSGQGGSSGSGSSSGGGHSGESPVTTIPASP
jgi:uncharacterized membrane protein YgcG